MAATTQRSSRNAPTVRSFPLSNDDDGDVDTIPRMEGSGHEGASASAGGVQLLIKSPWPNRVAHINALPSQRLCELAVQACSQLGLTCGQVPETELSVYGPDLRELPLDSTLEAACCGSNGSSDGSNEYGVDSDGVLRLHLLPYKVLWEQYWKGDGANQNQQTRHAEGQNNSSSAPADGFVAAVNTSGAQSACQPSTAADQPTAVLDLSEEPDWLPLYWHLWMSDAHHTARMPAAPPDGCPPVSFVHDAETPLSVSLDVFAGWMGISQAGQLADAEEQPLDALWGSNAGLDHSSLVCTESISDSGAQMEEAQPKGDGVRDSDEKERQQQQAPSGPAPSQPSGCGSWYRHMEWLRGGGTRMLRLLAAATTASSVGSSGSDGGSGGESANSSGTSSPGSNVRGSGNGGSSSSDGASAGCTQNTGTGGTAAAKGCPKGNGAAATAAMVVPLTAGRCNVCSRCECCAGQGTLPAAVNSATVFSSGSTGAIASSGLQLLWLNRQVSYDASPAELGMCDQSVVALLNLCDQPDCAACLLTRGSLYGNVEFIEKALAAGGLGAVDEQQQAPIGSITCVDGNPGCGSGISDGPAAADVLALSSASDDKDATRPPMLMPLGMAAANGHEGALKLLLQRRVDDPNVCDKFGLPALWFAVEHAQPGCVRLLLQGGARAADWVFAAPAVAAAVQEAPAAAAAERAAAERASAAAAAGLPLAVASYMALCHAVEVGDVRTVRELLRYGACPYTPDDSNGTPYHMAIERGDVEIVEALLEGDPAFEELQRAQADVYRRLLHASQRVERSEVAGCACVQCNYRVAIRAAASPETEELRAQLQLVALPAVMDAAPAEAAVSLMAAMRQRGALLDAHDADGYTALHLAVRAGNLDAIRWLLQQGADPMERDALGYMPLHLLAHYGCSAAPQPAPPAPAPAPAAATATTTATPASTQAAKSSTAAANASAATVVAEAAGVAPGSGSGCSSGGGAGTVAAAAAGGAASGAQLELAVARLLVEDARMPLGAKTTCFAYEADVRAEEKKLRAAPPGGLLSASSSRSGRRGAGGASSAASKKRSRDPMLTVPLYGGHTAAQLALRYGRPLLLAYLLHRGAPMDLSSATSRHCLEKALEAGHSAAARILLSYVQQGKPSAGPSAATAPPSASSTVAEAKKGGAPRPAKRLSGKGTPRDGSTSPPAGKAAPAPAAAVAAAVDAKEREASSAAAVMDGLVVDALPSTRPPGGGSAANAQGNDGTQPIAAASEVPAGSVASGDAAAASGSRAAAKVVAEAATEAPDALMLERRKARRTVPTFPVGGIGSVAKSGDSTGAAAANAEGSPSASGGSLSTVTTPATAAVHAAALSIAAAADGQALVTVVSPAAELSAAAGKRPLDKGLPLTGGTPQAADSSLPPTGAPSTSTQPSRAAGSEAAATDSGAAMSAAAAAGEEAGGAKSSRSTRRRAARREARKAAAAVTANGSSADTAQDAGSAGPSVDEPPGDTRAEVPKEDPVPPALSVQEPPATALGAATAAATQAPAVPAAKTPAIEGDAATQPLAAPPVASSTAPQGPSYASKVSARPLRIAAAAPPTAPAATTANSGDSKGASSLGAAASMAAGVIAEELCVTDAAGGPANDDGGEWQTVTGHRHRRTAGIAGASSEGGVAGSATISCAVQTLSLQPSATAGAAVASVAVAHVGGTSSPVLRSLSPERPAPIAAQQAASLAAPLAAAMTPRAPPPATACTPSAPGLSASSPLPAGQRPVVRRASNGSSGAAGSIGDSCGYIEVPRSLLYGKRGPTGQSPTAPTATAPAATSVATPRASSVGSLPPMPALPIAATLGSVATPAVPALPQPTSRPSPSTQTAVLTAAAPAAASSAAGVVHSHSSFAAAVKGEAAGGHPPPPLAAPASLSLPRHPSSCPAPTPTPGPASEQPAAQATVTAHSGRMDPVVRPAPEPMSGGSSSAGSGVGAATTAAAAGTVQSSHGRGFGGRAPGMAVTGKAAAAPAAGSTAGSAAGAAAVASVVGGRAGGAAEGSAAAGCSGVATGRGGSGAAAGSATNAGPTQPHAVGSKLNPQAHEFVPTRACTPAASGARSTAAPAAAAVHLTVPGVHVAPGTASRAAGMPQNDTSGTAGAAARPLHSAVPAPSGYAQAVGGRVPAVRAPTCTAPSAGATATPPRSSAPLAATASGLLSPFQTPGGHSGIMQGSPIGPPASRGVYGTARGNTQGAAGDGATAASQQPQGSLLPSHLQLSSQNQQPPASPVAQVMSWQAVQPIQVLSSPIRRLPDLPDLYRAMVSPYCSYMQHSPRATSTAGAAAAAAAAAASAAVSASAAAVAAAAAAAVAEAQAASEAAKQQHQHQLHQQPGGVSVGNGSGASSGCGSSPERQRRDSWSSSAPPYNPLTAPLPHLSMLPHGLFCGEQLIRPTCTRLWGLDPLQQLRATQTSLEATIAAAFGVPGYFTATHPMPDCSDVTAGACDGSVSGCGQHESTSRGQGMGAPSVPEDAISCGGAGGDDGGVGMRMRLSSSSGGGGVSCGGGMSSGVARALHSILAEEDSEEQQRQQESQQREGDRQQHQTQPLTQQELLRSAVAAAPAGPQSAGSQPVGPHLSSSAPASISGSAPTSAGGAGGAGGRGPRSRAPSPSLPDHSHQQQQQPQQLPQRMMGPPGAHIRHMPLMQPHREPGLPPRGGPPPGFYPPYGHDWRSAVIRLFTGACTPSVPAAAQPAVAAAALWWTAVRQAPEPQPHSDDGAPGNNAAGGQGGRNPRQHGQDYPSTGRGPSAGGWHGKGPQRSNGSGGGGSSGGGGVTQLGSGHMHGPMQGQAQGLVVMTQRVQVVGPMDADSMIAACLQGRLAPHTEVCGTLAGLLGPPPLELFEPLGTLLAAVQGGGGCYLLVERW